MQLAVCGFCYNFGKRRFACARRPVKYQIRKRTRIQDIAKRHTLCQKVLLADHIFDFSGRSLSANGEDIFYRLSDCISIIKNKAARPVAVVKDARRLNFLFLFGNNQLFDFSGSRNNIIRFVLTKFLKTAEAVKHRYARYACSLCTVDVKFSVADHNGVVFG